MINKEVIPAFEMLLDELDAIILESNKQGSQLMDEKKYPEAHGVISKAEAVVAFQVKVKALRDEWVEMDVPLTKSRPPLLKKRKKNISRVTTTKLETGLRTNEVAFRIPILQALVTVGGSARRPRVFDELEKIMADQLNKYDWQPLPSNTKSTRWKNTAAWARQDLIDEGFLSNTSARGIWEITPAGRAALEESKKKAS